MRKYKIWGIIFYKEHHLKDFLILWILLTKEELMKQESAEVENTENQLLMRGNHLQDGLLGAPRMIKIKVHQNFLHKQWTDKRQTTRELSIGDRVGLIVLMMPQEKLFPGAYDFARHGRIQGSVGQGIAIALLKNTQSSYKNHAPYDEISHKKKVDTIALYLSFFLFFNKKRYEFMEFLNKRLGPQASGAAGAILIGDKSRLNQNVLESFQNSGLGHILAVSGLHILLIFGCLKIITQFFYVLIFLKKAQYSNFYKPASCVAWLGLGIYFLLSGGAISAQRAFLMASLLIVSIFMNRPYGGLRALFFAAFAILILRPESIFHPSFQLSFAASLQLICMPPIPPAVVRFLHSIKLGFLTREIWSGFVLGCIMIPMTIYHFQRFNGQSVWANLLAIPLMSMMVMPVGLVIFCFWVILGEFTPHFCTTLWAWSLDLLIFVAQCFSQMPGATINVYFIQSYTLLFWYLGWFISLYFKTILKKDRLLSWVGFFSLAFSLWGIIKPNRPKILIDKQQKVAAIFHKTKNKIIIVGSPYYRRRVQKWARYWNIKKISKTKDHWMEEKWKIYYDKEEKKINIQLNNEDVPLDHYKEALWIDHKGTIFQDQNDDKAENSG